MFATPRTSPGPWAGVFRSPVLAAALTGLLLTGAAPRFALADTRLLRQPDLHGNTIVFVYGGDLWTVPRTGGTAVRITSDVGVEQYPAISPDGTTVAFTAEYDGNVDVFTIPIGGGEPKRLTYHPSADRIAAWYPDGKSLLLRSVRLSPTTRYQRYFRVPVDGGPVEVLPLHEAGPASWSPDGTKLVFNRPSMEFNTWKRYQGGSASEVWLFDFSAKKSRKLTDWTGTDDFPMWIGDTIYFNSDRTGKLNIWAVSPEGGEARPITSFTDFDVKWPSSGPDAIVFENGGRLHVLDLPSGQVTPITVTVPTDRILARPEVRTVGGDVRGASISPSAKRVALDVRGDIVTVPAEKGTWRNLTSTPGVHERNPAWSPDGKWVAYWSDASGEYDIHLAPQDGAAPGRALTKGIGGYGFDLRWSPDSKRIAFADHLAALWIVDAESGRTTRVDKSDIGDIGDYSWSADSKWLAYSKGAPNYYSVLHVYGVDDGRVRAVTDPFEDASEPVFDPEGKYLVFRSNRHFGLEFNAYDAEFVFPNPTGLYVLALQKSTASPVAPESDEEMPKGADSAEKNGAAKAGGDKKPGDDAKDGAAKTVVIDFDGLGERVAKLPVPPGQYAALEMVKGKLLFLSYGGNTIAESADDAPPGATLRLYDFEKRETKTVMAGVNGYARTPDGEKLLVRGASGWGIVEAKPDQKIEKPLAVDGIRLPVDPKAEWASMFAEAWRLERDFFYDPRMHGVDWNEVRRRYEPLVAHAAHRSDINYLLGEMIGELNCSHAYVGGGDFPRVPTVSVGLLGVDWGVDRAAGRYRFERIYRKSEWNQGVIAPLGAPGIDVRDGDYLLSVNGQAVTTGRDVYAWFEDTVGRPVTLRVNSRPDTNGARTVVVQPIGSEVDLRYTAWVDANRARVAEATGGRCGYLHVPDTAFRGHVEFSKGFYAQADRDALIVDGRFNSGGFIPDELVHRLARKPLSYWAQRDRQPFRTPSAAIGGPKVCITNEYAGSGGDALPYYFREWNLGPVVGKRTWGGLVGINRNIPLIDGGAVTFPAFSFYDTSGQYVVENHGVDMDVAVEQIPEEVMAGRDPQLEKAIELINAELAKGVATMPPPPPAPDRSKVKPAGR